MKPLRPSPALAAVVGAEPLPRTEVTKRLWDYIKAHNLQNPANKRLSWRHGISTNVLDTRMRVSEVANWIEYHVLPKRAKRGRG